MRTIIIASALAALSIPVFAADNTSSSVFCLNNPNNTNCAINKQYQPNQQTTPNTQNPPSMANPDSAGAATNPNQNIPNTKQQQQNQEQRE